MKGPKADPICLLQQQTTEWLVCFVPPMGWQWWHVLLWSPLKHCFCLRRDGPDKWVLFEPWWSRILVATITDEEADRFIDWGRKGVILKVKEHVPGHSSQLRGWLSCAALVAHLLGRRCFVYTPAQLLKRLRAESETEIFKGRQQ